MNEEKTQIDRANGEVNVDQQVIKFGGEQLANFITIAGWFVVVMYFVIANTLSIMFEASMLLIAVIAGATYLGLIIFLLIGLCNLTKWFWLKLTAKSL